MESTVLDAILLTLAALLIGSIAAITTLWFVIR